ncbi:GNAT family N-acetyltransferase [Halobacillus sp. BBL2006]|uniref:GNAT family N-acetyltransferase n=1 Tax=Halobacillus sp. BBL2006 TaxID=1543706 RepID=UPI0005428664|nr:GNAT family N-acetyltransferase [Halobacillus sp. BBL2006]KHE71866.1 GNAT family acetyltransferase [Halobacillus sp. BBL2006]
MKVIKQEDVHAFGSLAQNLLTNSEAENNLPLGILQRMQEDPSAMTANLLHIEEEGIPVYLTMRTPPHLWILPSVERMKQQHIQSLAAYLFEHNYDVPGVLGEEQAVMWFLEAWKGLDQTKEANLHMRQGIYRLEKLLPIAHQEGKLVVAEDHHIPRIAEWLGRFGEETNESIIRGQAKELAQDMVQTKRAHLWVVGGEPVSMVNRARKTPNGSTINAVYTPDQHKRKGYASQAVWSLTKKLLDEGCKFCALYTDLDNPTSNSIYKKIGYKWVGNSLVYHFEPKASKEST